MVVLPQFGDQLRSLQLYLRVGGQMVGGKALSDHSISLDVQIPVDTENKGGVNCTAWKHTNKYNKHLHRRVTPNASNREAKDAN